jgi:hypothetical protein
VPKTIGPLGALKEIPFALQLMRAGKVPNRSVSPLSKAGREGGGAVPASQWGGKGPRRGSHRAESGSGSAERSCQEGQPPTRPTRPRTIRGRGESVCGSLLAGLCPSSLDGPPLRTPGERAPVPSARDAHGRWI